MDPVLWIVTIISSAISIWTILEKDRLARFYSDDPEVIELTKSLLLFVCGRIMFAGIGQVLSSTLMGLSLPHAYAAMKSQIISTWVVQVPIALYLGFFSPWDFLTSSSGFLFGNAVAGFITVVLMWWYLHTTDWSTCAPQADASKKG